MSRLISFILAAFAICTLLGAAVRAQAEDLDALERQIQELRDAGRQAEAIPLGRRAAALAEQKFGPDDVETAVALYRLGNMLRRENQPVEALPLLQRALVIYDREAGGNDDIDVANTLRELGFVTLSTLRLAEAEQHLKRSLAMTERLVGPDAIEIAWLLDGLASTYVYSSQYGPAEDHAARAIEIKRRHLDPGDRELVGSIAMLATVQHRAGKLDEAARQFEQILATERAKPAPDLLTIADALGLVAIVNYDKADYETAERQVREVLALLEANNGRQRGNYTASHNLLAKILTSTGRHAEAEEWAKKVLAAYGVVPIVHARDALDATNTLSIIYHSLDRYADAEQALKRAISIGEATFGEMSIDVALLLENLSYLYASIERSEEAIELFGRILRIRNAVLEPSHPLIGSTLANRARVLNKLNRHQEAEADARAAIRNLEANYSERYPMALSTRDELGTALKGLKRNEEAIEVYKDAIRITRTAEGEKATRIGTLLHNLGLVLDAAGRHQEAEEAFLTSNAGKEPGSVYLAQTLNVLGDMYMRTGRPKDALERYREASRIFIKAFNAAAAGPREYEGSIWLKSNSWTHLGALLDSPSSGPGEDRARAEEGFEVAQWVMRTSTAAALSQLGARYAAGSGELAGKTRQRQDATRLLQRTNGELDRLIAQPIGARNEARVTALRADIARLESEVARLDDQLSSQFPAFAELSSPRPLTVADVRGLLRGNEALVQILQLNGFAIGWVVTPDDVRWYRIAMDAREAIRAVAVLRCGLDRDGNWDLAGDGQRWLGRSAVCKELAPDGLGPRQPLPYDLGRAHDLYRQLLGPAEDLIRGRNLLVVTSWSWTQLPFQVLVAGPPQPGVHGLDAYRHAAWLGARHTITVLPAVSSLKALREHARSSRATEPLIAFGNPLLDGPDHRWRPAALQAKQNGACGTRQMVTAHVEASGAGVGNVVVRGGVADGDSIRALPPLPETADELCEVARALGVEGRHVRLAGDATEAAVKALSDSDRLASYRIVHFATHGLVSGELTGATEPGLVLTPPEAASERDDGYLTASEIAGLKLDADWVILSACNTAAAGSQGAEALSGLARAFFYAGARALLVSHWSVDSAATVKLVTRTLSALAGAPQAGRAQALRQAMEWLVRDGEAHEAHPAYWAPFVVVGEGAGDR